MSKVTHFMALMLLVWAIPSWLTVSVTTPSFAADALKPNDELTYRASLGSAAEVELLLKQGAEANARNKDGVPALSLAAARKDGAALDVVKTLVDHGAAIDQPDAAGQTALFYAARVGKKEMITYLLEHKANYYALDNKGDVARNIAFREGHPECVELMDNFVKNQSQQVMQQYLDYNKMIEQHMKEVQDASAAAQDPNLPEPPPVAVPKPVAPVTPPPAVAPVAVAQPIVAATPPAPVVQPPVAAQPQAPVIPPKPFNETRMRELVTNLSASSCAFQYWAFCRSVRQHTEMSADTLDDLVDNERKQMSMLGASLIAEFSVSGKYVNQIIIPSKKQIYDQLNKMGWNGYRKENGVGTTADMQARCERIAKNWQIIPPGRDALDIDAITPGDDKDAKASGGNPANRGGGMRGNGGGMMMRH